MHTLILKNVPGSVYAEIREQSIDYQEFVEILHEEQLDGLISEE